MSENKMQSAALAEERPARLGLLRWMAWSVPLGWQLSALYTLLLVVTLSLVGAVVYTQQESFLVQDAAGRLQQTAQRVASINMPPDSADFNPPAGGYGGFGRSPDQQGGFGGPGENNQNRLLSNLIRGLSGPDTTVAVLDSQANVITATQALYGDITPVVDTVTQAQASSVVSSGAPAQWVVTRDTGVRYVVVLLPISVRAVTTTFLLEQSASLAGVDAALNRLGLFLILGVLGGTIAGVALGISITRALLRPLDRVATTAEAIAGGDLERRLRLPQGQNEVARLGKAFDFMVGRLVSSLEAQRRFVADASHELRTPLTSLKGLAEILMIGAHGNNTQVIEQSAQAMNSELDRLGRLVNDLLTLSRLENSGGQVAAPTRRSKMDLCATISAATAQMYGVAQNRAVKVTHDCPAPLWINGDNSQLKQVLLNLVDNALRYTEPGGEIGVHGVVAGTNARIEVRDTGAGIDPRDLPHIFERFYRGDASRARATGNSGLGLAIVQAIITAHGGSIEAQSEVGKGTTFIIQLPLSTAPTASEEPAALMATR